MKYYFHDDGGKIHMTGSCIDSMIDLQQPPIGWLKKIGEARIAVDYHDNLVGVLPRPTQAATLSNTPIIANGIDSGVLQYLPIPCTVFIEDTPYQVADGVLEFTLNLPGIYQIKITNCFPYLDKEFTCEGLSPV